MLCCEKFFKKGLTLTLLLLVATNAIPIEAPVDERQIILETFEFGLARDGEIFSYSLPQRQEILVKDADILEREID
jgi:hypothetical protein